MLWQPQLCMPQLGKLVVMLGFVYKWFSSRLSFLKLIPNQVNVIMTFLSLLFLIQKGYSHDRAYSLVITFTLRNTSHCQKLKCLTYFLAFYADCFNIAFLHTGIAIILGPLP